MAAQSLVPVVGILIGILALIGAGGRLLHANLWRSKLQPGRALILRETIALDARRRLHLVQCGERQVVLLTGGTQDLIVGWMQHP